MKISKSLSKYFWIFRTDLKQRSYYTADYVLTALFIVVILFVFANLWKSIFMGRTVIEGFSIAQLVWYLTLTEAITMGMGWRTMFEDVSDEVKSGSIANYLTKPLSYIGWHFSVFFSKFLNYFLIVFAVGSVVTYLMVGPIQFSILTLALLTIVILLSFVLSFFIGMAFASFAFWFEDVTAFYWILQKAVFIMGGMLVPLDIYPDFIKGYLNYIPFSFLTYWPGKFFITGSGDIFIITLIGQIAWIFVFIVFLTVIYKSGIRRVNIHGG
jgi:ABC-2 type transport system permease protein